MRTLLRLIVVGLAIAGVNAGSSTQAAQVRVDGNAIPHANSAVEVTVSIIEERLGEEERARLVRGESHYSVCIVARDPVPVFDVVLPSNASATRFQVTVEDGRLFMRCLVASLKAAGEGSRRRLTYCLRCEDVTTP